MKPREPRLTLKDVARLAGVSPALASMALADSTRVAATTKEAVRHAAHQLGYIPNSSARALRSQRVGAIAVVVPLTSQQIFSHPYFMDVLQGITTVANSHDLTVILSTSPIEEDQDAAYVKILRSRRADGVIVASAPLTDRNISRLVSSGYPVSFIGRIPHDPTVVSVSGDERDGAEQATTHLLHTHHLDQIAHISGPLGHQSAIDKLEGYRTALARHGRVYREQLVVEGDYSQESGYSACTRLLTSGVPFNGLFAANDEMALGVFQALREHQIRIPQDIAVVGFDNTRLSQVVHPALTTIHAPIVDIGRLAAERLISLIHGTPLLQPQLEMPTILVVRQSCGCEEVDE